MPKNNSMLETDRIFELHGNGKSLREIMINIHKNDCRSTELMNIHRAKLLIVRNFIESPLEMRINNLTNELSTIDDLPYFDTSLSLNNQGVGSLTRKINFSSWKKDFPMEMYKCDSSNIQRLRQTPREEITIEMCNSVVDEVPLKFKYWNNLELPENFPSLLKESVNEFSNISSENNKECGKLTGMNTPMYYLATANSYCEMHLEDSDLESINAVLYNILSDENEEPFSAEFDASKERKDRITTTTSSKKKAVSKLWLIVPNKNSLMIALAKYAKKGKCPYFIFHKNTYITTKFLIENDIEFQFALQFPGDLIIVKKSIFHQVINITPNFCEAINYASAGWNLISDAIFTCFCRENKYTVIRPNSEAMVFTKTKKITLIHCEDEKCARSFTNKIQYANHMKKEHNVAKPLKCDRCEKRFASMSGIRLHYCISEKDVVVTQKEDNAISAAATSKTTTSKAPKRYRCKVCDIKVIHKWHHAKLTSHKNKGRFSHNLYHLPPLIIPLRLSYVLLNVTN